MKQLLLFLSLIITASVSYCQFNYVAANGVNLAGTYTDLGANGTVIATDNFDEANSEAQDIGFNFIFNGTTYTQFILNTNGVIKLGANPPTTDINIFDALASPETDLIYPLNLDLDAGTAPEYRVYTSGTAGNRICTIQYKNVSDWFPADSTAPQFSDMDFQVKLYETSNNVEFVYGTFVAGGAFTNLTPTAVGIKGTDASSSVNVTKSSLADWSAATFINGNYTGNAHNTRNTVLPVSGRTYRFVYAVLPANDAQVATIYTLGKVPLVYGSPHTVNAIVKNAGSDALTNLAVTLNVTGANTFTNSQTVPSIPPGTSATVTFAGYNSTNLGTNNLTVSVAADDNITNNSVTVTQAVTTGIFSYAGNGAPFNSVGYNVTSAGLFVNKYSLSGFAFVNSVNIFISNDDNNIGNTIYAVVLDPGGAIIGRSADYVIVAADLDNYKRFDITTAPFIAGGDFFVGMAQTAAVALRYFPLGIQQETPVRSGAYFTAPLAGGSAPVENVDLGIFMIEAVVAIAPLPIKLTGFGGRIQNNNAILNWLTGNENNSDRFDVERTPAGSGTWLKIGTVAAVGNSAITTKYQFTDPGLSNGRWMYRLKIIDKDGKFAYSPVVILQVTGKPLFALGQNYPNPVKDATMIRYELGNDAIVTIELYSMDGKKIMGWQKGKQTKGSYNLPVEVKSLALSNGKYVYRMVAKDNTTGEIITLRKEMNVIR
ncbi:MAG: T9SS type A sorting domain-containing protein [Ferruginibacter sp.]